MMRSAYDSARVKLAGPLPPSVFFMSSAKIGESIDDLVFPE